MSSILKALKKVEEEKAARRNGGTDVAKGILRNIPAKKRSTRWILPVSVAGSALAAALLTYYLTGSHSSPRGEALTTASVKTAQEAKEVKAPIQAPAQVLKTVEHPPNGPLVAQTADLPEKKHVARAVAAPSSGKQPGRLPKNRTDEGTLPEERMPSPTVAIAPQKRTVEPVQPKEVGSPPPKLRVSGIAWNKDSSERLAVVNGMSVTEGTTIEGARVEQIMKDKVRFSFEKKTFDVAVGNEIR